MKYPNRLVRLIGFTKKLGFLGVFLFSLQSFGKAYYAPKQEMIQQADAIAIITIGEVKRETNQGEHWAYREVAYAETEKVLKGTLPPKFEILGREDFICAQCLYSPGRFIVFLRRDGLKWVCSNWTLSIRPIVNEQVDWFDSKPKALKTVVEDITSFLDSAAKAAKQNSKCKSDSKVYEVSRKWFDQIGNTLDHQPQMIPEVDQIGRVTGFKVARVNSDSFASKAGLRKGDIVIEFDGEPIINPKASLALMDRLKAGQTVCLTVMRSKKMKYWRVLMQN